MKYSGYCDSCCTVFYSESNHDVCPECKTHLEKEYKPNTYPEGYWIEYLDKDGVTILTPTYYPGESVL